MGKNTTSSKNAKFRKAEKFIEISECTKTLNNTIMLRYLRKVQRISDKLVRNKLDLISEKLIADMPNDLTTFCAVIGTILLEYTLETETI